MPLQQTSGNVTADAYGGTGGVSVIPNYIEDVFSTWLYTGNGATQTITNGIDLAGKGGLVWAKSRSSAAQHILADTVRGTGQILQTSTTSGNIATALNITSFNVDGYGLSSYSGSNGSGITYVSWTFRKQPKFFDVVTYTGTGVNRTIGHALGSAPGCVIVKRTDTTGNWQVYHNGLTSAAYSIQLNLTAAEASTPTIWNSTAPTASVFSVGTDATVNASGGTYVAYIFAHNAGGFGLTGTDNVISCGTFTTDAGGNASVTLGYEPQWVMVKSSSAIDGWIMLDVNRGWSMATNDQYLSANTASAESVLTGGNPTATGFVSPTLAGGQNYIYIAIRRGSMKVPTDGTKVFKPVAYSGNNSARTITAGFPVDAELNMVRSSAAGHPMVSRLTGGRDLDTAKTGAEGTLYTTYLGFDNQTGMAFKDATGYSYYNSSANTYVAEMFRRAPGFFDEVCYTGTGSATTQAHNLGVAPELMIVKSRTGTQNWPVYSASLGNTKGLFLNLTSASADNSDWNNTTPTASVFSIGSGSRVNDAAATYVAYLFASAPGVSKVGSYTGNGTTQTINCGFTGGARFVLIKRTDDTGDWYVYDTARGMTTLTDPYLLLNSAAAETATLGSVTTVTTGFAVNATILAAINTNAASYIYLSIA